MKPKYIGTFYLGFDQAKLFVCEGMGGSFWACPEGKLAKIEIGLDTDLFEQTLGSLMHEVLELVLYKKECRYTPNNHLSTDNDRFTFITTHGQFSDAVDKTAEYINSCEKKLKKAWKKRRKEVKKKK